MRKVQAAGWTIGFLLLVGSPIVLSGLLIGLTMAPVDSAGGRREPKFKTEQDLKEDLENLKKSLVLYKQQGLKEKEVETIAKIADLYFKLEKPKESERIIRENLNLFRTSKDTDREKLLISTLRKNLTKSWTFSAGFGWVVDRDLQVRYGSGKISWGDILDFSNFNLFVSRLVGDRQQEIASLHGIGWTYRNLGKFYDAKKYFMEAIELAKSENDKSYISFL